MDLDAKMLKGDVLKNWAIYSYDVYWRPIEIHTMGFSKNQLLDP